MDRSRSLAPIALLITGAAVLYAASAAVTGREPPPGWPYRAVIHIGELLVVLALARAAAGTGRAARLGLGTALLGTAALVVGEVVWPHYAGLGDILFSVGPLLAGVGLIVAGVPVTRRWTGWRRFMPLCVGAYVFLVLLPVMIGPGGPPAPAALWTIAGWDTLWTLTALAVLTSAPAPALAHPASTSQAS